MVPVLNESARIPVPVVPPAYLCIYVHTGHVFQRHDEAHLTQGTTVFVEPPGEVFVYYLTFDMGPVATTNYPGILY